MEFRGVIGNEFDGKECNGKDKNCFEVKRLIQAMVSETLLVEMKTKTRNLRTSQSQSGETN